MARRVEAAEQAERLAKELAETRLELDRLTSAEQVVAQLLAEERAAVVRGLATGQNGPPLAGHGTKAVRASIPAWREASDRGSTAILQRRHRGDRGSCQRNIQRHPRLAGSAWWPETKDGGPIHRPGPTAAADQDQRRARRPTGAPRRRRVLGPPPGVKMVGDLTHIPTREGPVLV